MTAVNTVIACHYCTKTIKPIDGADLNNLISRVVLPIPHEVEQTFAEPLIRYYICTDCLHSEPVTS